MSKYLYQILYDVDHLFRLKNLQYWLISKSFLGAICNGGILKNDKDIDIAIKYSHIKVLKSLEKELRKCNYVLEKGKHGYVIRDVRREHPYLDIYTMKKNGQKYEPSKKSVKNKKPNEYFREKELFPLRRVAFGGFLAFVPKEYERYFNRKFDEWKIGKTVKYEPIRKRKCLPEPSQSKYMNFLSRVYVINLHDYRQRMDRIARNLKNKKIPFTIFDAIDGRCANKLECERKRKALESEYRVKISRGEGLPVLSLTLGTWIILSEQVRNKWPVIAILEDDAVLDKNFTQRFKEGIKELKKMVPRWDILYLGCSEQCGSRGISPRKTSRNKYLTTINKFVKNQKFYVSHKDDVRLPCHGDDCQVVSKNLSIPYNPSGGFGYCVSLKGARKILKEMNRDISDHMDYSIKQLILDGTLNAVSFDPPIVQHYGGADRVDTILDWQWE